MTRRACVTRGTAVARRAAGASRSGCTTGSRGAGLGGFVVAAAAHGRQKKKKRNQCFVLHGAYSRRRPRRGALWGAREAKLRGARADPGRSSDTRLWHPAERLDGWVARSGYPRFLSARSPDSRFLPQVSLPGAPVHDGGLTPVAFRRSPQSAHDHLRTGYSGGGRAGFAPASLASRSAALGDAAPLLARIQRWGNALRAPLVE